VNAQRKCGFAAARRARDHPATMNLPMAIRLAQWNDATTIAVMSRDLIERGLGWSWTAARVRRSIVDRHTNVAVVPLEQGGIGGFGIMKYDDEEAHLLLLAVRPALGRRGLGSALLQWLEKSAQVGGTAQIQVEARVTNGAARSFYRRHGYREVALLPGYYSGREASVRLVKELRRPINTPQQQA
jgi:ribosomal-protein-alanine N-acetyltransferase